MLYEFDPRKYRFAIEIGTPNKLERLDKIPRPHPNETVAMAINWSVFDWVGANDGYGEIEQDGVQLQKPSKAFPSMSFKDGKLVYGDVPGAQVGAGIAMTLVLDGKVNIINTPKMSTARNHRTACGQKSNDSILFVTVDNMTTQELAEYMIKQGCIIAFQGDSGGSTGYFDGVKLCDQGRAIAGALVAYREVEQMRTNIVISYSQQRTNACAMGDTEQDHMYTIAEALYDILSEDARLNVYLVPLQNTGTDSGNLKAAIKLSNKFIKANGGKRYHIELHSDAGGGKGAVGLYVSEAGKRLVSALMGALDDITPAPDEDRIRKRTDLGALNQTIAVTGIIEVSFHDKPDEAKWIHENGVSIAVAIAYGFYKFMKGEKLI
jgi:hypothetical protein